MFIVTLNNNQLKLFKVEYNLKENLGRIPSPGHESRGQKSELVSTRKTTCSGIQYRAFFRAKSGKKSKRKYREETMRL